MKSTDQNQKKLTKSRDRSEGKIGAIFWIFEFMVEKRNSWGNPWQPKAADTNMLRVHLVGGPIFKDFDLESGGIGGERRGTEVEAETRRTPTNSRTQQEK